MSMQGIRRDVLHAQAAPRTTTDRSMDPQAADNATYVTSFTDALAQAQGNGQDSAHRLWPAALADIRSWREALCTRLGWTPLFPLFGSDTARLAREMIDGLRAHLCCVDTTQLDAAFAGRAFDAALLAELPPGVDRCGEHGEFHTCVSAGPMFAAPLALRAGGTVPRRTFAYTDFKA